METNQPIMTAAININRYDVIKLPEIDINMQVLIEPCKKDGHIEIIYQGQPHVYPLSQKILLIKKAVKNGN